MVACVADVILSQLVTSAKQPRGSCSTPQTDLMNQLSEGLWISLQPGPITERTQSWYTGDALKNGVTEERKNGDGNDKHQKPCLLVRYFTVLYVKFVFC